MLAFACNSSLYEIFSTSCSQLVQVTLHFYVWIGFFSIDINKFTDESYLGLNVFEINKIDFSIKFGINISWN